MHVDIFLLHLSLGLLLREDFPHSAMKHPIQYPLFFIILSTVPHISIALLCVWQPEDKSPVCTIPSGYALGSGRHSYQQPEQVNHEVGYAHSPSHSSGLQSSSSTPPPLEVELTALLSAGFVASSFYS